MSQSAYDLYLSYMNPKALENSLNYALKRKDNADALCKDMQFTPSLDGTLRGVIYTHCITHEVDGWTISSNGSAPVRNLVFIQIVAYLLAVNW